MSESNESQNPLDFDLRERTAAAIEDALGSAEASASGYGREFVRLDGEGAVTLDGCFRVDVLADAVIRELGLGQEWRADFGYDGYVKCGTREQAKAQVDGFNAAMGDDIRDGEQAMVMRRYVTDWKADE